MICPITFKAWYGALSNPRYKAMLPCNSGRFHRAASDMGEFCSPKRYIKEEHETSNPKTPLQPIIEVNSSMWTKVWKALWKWSWEEENLSHNPTSCRGEGGNHSKNTCTIGVANLRQSSVPSRLWLAAGPTESTRKVMLLLNKLCHKHYFLFARSAASKAAILQEAQTKWTRLMRLLVRAMGVQSHSTRR